MEGSIWIERGRMGWGAGGRRGESQTWSGEVGWGDSKGESF